MIYFFLAPLLPLPSPKRLRVGRPFLTRFHRRGGVIFESGWRHPPQAHPLIIFPHPSTPDRNFFLPNRTHPRLICYLIRISFTGKAIDVTGRQGGNRLKTRGAGDRDCFATLAMTGLVIGEERRWIPAFARMTYFFRDKPLKCFT